MSNSHTHAHSFAQKIKRTIVILSIIVLAVLGYSIVVNPLEMDLSSVQRFITFFLSMLVQSFPFLLAGTFVSSIIHFCVPESFITKILSARDIRAIPAALFAAICLPVCDCASVPVASRLLKKGASLTSVVTYMLASPILNPVVIASTFYAFPDYRPIVAARIALGVFVPVVVGLILSRVFRSFPVVAKAATESCSCGCDHAHEEEEHIHEDHCEEEHKDCHSYKDRIISILIHTGEEFVYVSPFIIAGAAVSALVQVAVPREALLLTSATSRFFIQPAIMIAAAFVLSVCSTSDAFIARGFSSAFSHGSILGFMVAGPMLDIKNVLMMILYFRKRFIVVLAVVVVSVTYLSAVLVSLLFFGAH
jgi:hypothetical protein